MKQIIEPISLLFQIQAYDEVIDCILSVIQYIE